MILPTIGRKLWYWPPEDFPHPDKSQPLDATIAYVHSMDCINIGFRDQNGVPYAAQQIYLWHGEGNRPVGAIFGYCEWMLFQKGQAMKTEALEIANAAPGTAFDVDLDKIPFTPPYLKERINALRANPQHRNVHPDVLRHLAEAQFRDDIKARKDAQEAMIRAQMPQPMRLPTAENDIAD